MYLSGQHFGYAPRHKPKTQKKAGARSIQVTEGLLSMTVSSAVPFIMKSGMERDYAMSIPHVEGWRFWVGDDGKTEGGMRHLDKRHEQEPVALKDMGSSPGSANGLVAEGDTIMPFPYDPTGTFPFMLGDEFIDLRGQEWMVSGFYYIEDKGIEVVLKKSTGKRGSGIAGTKDLKEADIEHFRLRDRRVVDWETYLTLMAQWSEAEYMTFETFDELGTGAPPKNDEIAEGENVCDAVREYHCWSAETVKTYPYDEVLNGVAKNEYEPTEEDFEEWGVELFRIRGRSVARDVLRRLFANAEVHGDECITKSVTESEILSTLKSRFAATRVESIRDGGQAKRMKSSGRMVSGEGISESIDPVYDKIRTVMKRIEKGLEPDREEDKEDPKEEMDTFGFLESM
jgi:hypothetical protein